MDDLLREAIADAKAVRETALANAKIALEEAFTPRLQSMLSKKIASEMEDKDEEDSEEMREADYSDKEGKVGSGDGHVEKIKEPFTEAEHEEGEHEEEMEEAMHDKDEEDSEEMRHADEAMHDKEEEMDKDEEMDAEEMRDSEEMRDAEEAMHDKEEMRNSEEEMDKDEEMDSDEEMEEAMHDKDEEMEEDELDLESVLAELEKDLDDEDSEEEMRNEEMDKDEEDKEEEDKVDETVTDASSEIGSGDNKLYAPQNDSSKIGAQGPEGEGSDKAAGTELGDHEVVKEPFTEEMDKDEEDKEENDLDLDEVLRALTEEDKEEEDKEENEKLKKEIKEHRKVIHFMRSKLNEVNLLNAKLLFSNKLFRAFGLNNNQKLKVVETFDRTKNLREVKLVYATLAESFKRPGKRLSESVKKGSASKPVRSTKPKAVLSEGQELKARFKKLANIL